MQKFNPGDRVVLTRTGYGIRSDAVGWEGEVESCRLEAGGTSWGNIYIVNFDRGMWYYVPESYLRSAGEKSSGNPVLDKINHMWRRQNYMKGKSHATV